MTREELDRAVRSLHSVGGLYELIALCVESDNVDYCEETL